MERNNTHINDDNEEEAHRNENDDNVTSHDDYEVNRINNHKYFSITEIFEIK